MNRTHELRSATILFMTGVALYFLAAMNVKSLPGQMVSFLTLLAVATVAAAFWELTTRVMFRQAARARVTVNVKRGFR